MVKLTGTLLAPVDAGLALNMTPEALRYREKIGHIRAIRDSRNNRLFLPSEIQRLKRRLEREEASRARQAQFREQFEAERSRQTGQVALSSRYVRSATRLGIT